MIKVTRKNENDKLINQKPIFPYNIFLATEPEIFQSFSSIPKGEEHT